MVTMATAWSAEGTQHTHSCVPPVVDSTHVSEHTVPFAWYGCSSHTYIQGHTYTRHTHVQGAHTQEFPETLHVKATGRALIQDVKLVS